jgi:hypothetical protein
MRVGTFKFRTGSHATLLKQLTDVIIVKILRTTLPTPPSDCYITHGHGFSRNGCISITLTDGRSSSFYPSGQRTCTNVFISYCLAWQVRRINPCLINPLTLELNPSAQRCLTRFLLGILLLEPCISFIYA